MKHHAETVAVLLLYILSDKLSLWYSDVAQRMMAAVNGTSAAKSRDLSTVNCLVLQKLASAVIQLTDTQYQSLVSYVVSHN